MPGDAPNGFVFLIQITYRSTVQPVFNLAAVRNDRSECPVGRRHVWRVKTNHTFAMEEPKSRRKSKDAIDAVSDDKSCRKSVRGYASDDKSRKSERSERKERERRERKKKERRAQKLAQRFKELGLDENGNELDNFSLLKYPVRECKFRIFGSTEPLALNPVVTLIAVVCLWSIVVWCTGTLLSPN